MHRRISTVPQYWGDDFLKGWNGFLAVLQTRWERDNGQQCDRRSGLRVGRAEGTGGMARLPSCRGARTTLCRSHAWDAVREWVGQAIGCCQCPSGSTTDNRLSRGGESHSRWNCVGWERREGKGEKGKKKKSNLVNVRSFPLIFFFPGKRVMLWFSCVQRIIQFDMVGFRFTNDVNVASMAWGDVFYNMFAIMAHLKVPPCEQVASAGWRHAVVLPKNCTGPA